MAYGPDNLVERDVSAPAEVISIRSSHAVTWINVDGVGDAETVKQLGDIFELHSLALEDVVNTHQRAKVESYGDHLFIVVRIAANSEQLETEQVSIFLGRNYVLTFQGDVEGDCFEPVRDRLRKATGRIRIVGADSLVYALIDAAIDGYFPVVERFADQLDALEDEITTRASPATIHQLHTIRNDFLLLRRSVRPHREAVNELIRDEHPLITQETRLYLRDCYDHTVQLMDLLEIYRESCSDLRDYYLSIVSNRMNEIMKVLTIISTIFMPLSFIAGVYGMNFDTDSPWNMPELRWKFGYVFAWSVMIIVAAGLVGFIWRRGWLTPVVTERNGEHHDGRAP
jgi:magnesium transporter